MNKTEEHAPDEKPHRLVKRVEPQRLKDRCGACISKECLGKYIDHISEETAEHEAPECGTDTAPEEHGDHFFHVLSHIRIFLQYDCRSDDHEKAVARIGKHHSEEEHIEGRHDHCRIDLPVFRKSVGSEDRFIVRGELIVPKEGRSLLFLALCFCVYYRSVLFLKKTPDLRRGIRRHPSFKEKHGS